MLRVLFVDRDGTLVAEPPDEQIDALGKVRLVPGVVPALERLVKLGYELVMVTNQDGLGTAAFPEEDFVGPHRFILDLFSSQGIEFREVFICPHEASVGCSCRKPATGLLDEFLAGHDIDRDNSFVIGDRETDMQLAAALAVEGLRLGGASGLTWNAVLARIVSRARSARVSRATNETRVDVRVELDARSIGRRPEISIDTGIGFFDHMLEQLALHGGFSLDLTCVGDLDVDEHHSVEDVALSLGEALDRALGSRRGIGRYGFLLPMDESLARIAVDLGGRPFCRFEGDFARPTVGGLATELVPHFFHSLSQTLRAALHISVTGDNTHHMVEACFKGLGRALRPALEVDGDALPSSKGVL